MVHVLYGTVLVAAVVAGVRSMSGAPVPASDPVPVAAEPASRGQVPAMPAMGDDDEAPAAANQAPSSAIEGQVLEVIEVPNYSYLRVGGKGTDGSWVAVPTAKLTVGASVRVGSAMKMVDFKSTALNRTFPVIYFGTLDTGGSSRAAAPAGDNPHGSMGAAAGDNPHGSMGAGMGDNPHGSMGAGAGSDPHGGMQGSAAAPAVDVKSVPKAEGANGKTVAEVIGQRTTLSGKSVRIRGTVVKVNAGILGRTYLHLRDGSGDATAATNDILVTTEAVPNLGETILVEGVVAIDRDIGAGYKFSTMVEDAKLVSKP